MEEIQSLVEFRVTKTWIASSHLQRKPKKLKVSQVKASSQKSLLSYSLWINYYSSKLGKF